MKQYPDRLNFKKNHKFSNSFLVLKEQKSFFPFFGNFGLKALESGNLTFKQIEACRKSIRRNLRKLGLVSIRVFTFSSKTKKAIGIRMGKGKGNHSIWICPVKAGQIICEVSGVYKLNAIFALKSASNKLPIKVQIVKASY